jgi:V/A-type H+-transporting ATPase subunit I
MLRPAATRWFEVLCPRSESVRTVAELALTGAVEIQVRDPADAEYPLRDLGPGLVELQRLMPRYKRYWDRGHLRQSTLVEPPAVMLERALARIAVWRREADPLIDELQASEEELARLRWLATVIEQIAQSNLDFSALTEAGPVLGVFCAVVAAGVNPDLPEHCLARQVPWQAECCWIVLAPADQIDQAKARIKAGKGRIIDRPDWVRGSASGAVARIDARRRFLSIRRVHLLAELDTLFEEYALDRVLGDAIWLDWFHGQVGALEPASANLAWITGWTDDLDGQRLAATLDRAQTRALLRLSQPPAGLTPPQVLVNPRWVRPFELFAKAFGVPGSDESDPTPLLAIVVPLMFGYMFGDVGQGLVFVALGLWLMPRFEIARLLVVAGASAALFGLLFGSLFGVEGVVPALWLHPLQHPLLVLGVPLVFAVGLLSLGQLLAGLGALRRGRLGEWLAVDLGFLVLYLGLVLMLVRPSLGWLALLGLAWHLLGAFAIARGFLGSLAAIAHLLENAMQLLTNTLSFARVGAFALAHSALSLAVVTMAESAPDWAWLPVMLLGNLIILALEGLVVSIQTTRLILFEFFNRFLRGTGRIFRPLPPPPALISRGVS